MMGKQGRRRQQLLDGLQETRGYCKLKEEALDRTLRRTHFRRGQGSVVTQITECMNVILSSTPRSPNWSFALRHSE